MYAKNVFVDPCKRVIRGGKVTFVPLILLGLKDNTRCGWPTEITHATQRYTGSGVSVEAWECLS